MTNWVWVIFLAFFNLWRNLCNSLVSSLCQLTKKRPLPGRSSMGREKRYTPGLVWQRLAGTGSGACSVECPRKHHLGWNNFYHPFSCSIFCRCRFWENQEKLPKRLIWAIKTKTAHSCPITLNNRYNGMPPAPALEWLSPWNGLGRAGAAASNTEYFS